MTKTRLIRRKLKCRNIIEITIFDNDPTHETANILIKLVANKRKNQQSIYKIEPLDQTALLLELRNVKYQSAVNKPRDKRSGLTSRCTGADNG
jgi:hypothetical protein